MKLAVRKNDPVDHQEEILKLRTRLDTHIQDYREHILEEERRYLQDMQKQSAMSANIEQLIKGLEIQAEATKGLVEAWIGANFLRKFVIWLSGFSGIGAFILWYNDFFTK